LALMRGFVRELLHILAWISAAVIAVKAFPYAKPLVAQYLQPDLLANLATGAGIFIVALVILVFVFAAIAKRVRESDIGMLDRSLGLVFGIARGAYSFEYERLSPGLDAWTAGQRLREIVPAIQKLWAGDYEHQGETWSFPKTTSAPKPLQRPHPPIWIAARDPNSHDFAVANGCNVQVTPLWLDDDEVVSLMARFNDACANNPKVPRPKIMLLRHTFVGETAAEVEQGAIDISRFYCYFGAWFKNERPVSQGLIQQLSEEEMAAIEMFSPANMRANNVVGTPDEVIARLKAYEALGYDQYSFWIDTGMSFEKKKRSLELFIKHVQPAFS
jgi:alkanesulfonate monooxygenase SsuD/methylene tetrahydromethanopterin reductase-like flavin-dependent oxidoreductase (luciferase family)